MPTIFRPEMINGFSHLSDEEKRIYGSELCPLWIIWDNYPKESARIKEATIRKIQRTSQKIEIILRGRTEDRQQQQPKLAAEQPQQPEKPLQHGSIRWTTISRDCTLGTEARDAELLTQFGNRLQSGIR